jgi:hypothetical protein
MPEKITSKGAGLPAVFIVVLTWNGKDLTLDCLESLEKLDYPRLYIIVVDNGSTDGTAEAVKGRYGDRVDLVRNDANLGFAGGNNVGIDHALRQGADFVLLLNNDTVVDPDLVGNLLAAMLPSPRIGITGPKIYFHDSPDRIWFAGGEVHLCKGITRHRGIREKDRGQYDEPIETDFITGCAMMVKREVFSAIGKLDESYPAYFEDTDFCMRARRAGFLVVYAPGGRVWHKVSRSTGGQLSPRKAKLKLRSGWIFFKRYARPYHWLFIPFFFIADTLRIAVLIAAGRIRNG